jgi:uncharacterized membrane-anchored protein YhcB (DUF1043 family)
MSKEQVKDLIPIDVHDECKNVIDYLNSIVEFKIETPEQYENAGNILVEIKRKLNELETKRKDIVKPFNDKVKLVNEYIKQYTTKLENAESTFKKSRTTWFAEQERKRIEAQRKAEAEAAEERRKAEEKANAERAKAESYREQGRDDLADKAEARAETAETIALNTVAPVIEAINTGKSSMKKVWRIEVINKQKATEAIASNAALSCFLQIDIKGLEKFANVTKGNLVIEGCRVYEDYVESVRTR